MNFGQALEAMKLGSKIKRAHWGGYWFYTNDVFLTQDKNVLTLNFEKGMIVAVLKDNGGYSPAQAYQGDLLAEDWDVVND